jgi:hypothetical protein
VAADQSSGAHWRPALSIALIAPDEAMDVVDIQIGIASQGGVSGLAFRFLFRDGSARLFALTGM